MLRISLLVVSLALAACNPKLEASIEKVTPTDKGYEVLVHTNRNAQVLPEGLTSASNATNHRPAWVLLRFEDLATLPRPVKLIVTAGDQKQILELSAALVPGEFAPVAGPWAGGVDVVGPHVTTCVPLSGSKAVLEFKLEPGQQLEIDGDPLEGPQAEVPLFPLIKDAKAFGSDDSTQELGELEVKRSGTGPGIDLNYVVRARTEGLDALRAEFVSQVVKGGGLPGPKVSGTQILFVSYGDEKAGKGFVSGAEEKIALDAIANMVLRKQKMVDGPKCPGKYVNQETGEKVDVKRYRADLTLEVYDTATGELLGQHAFSSRMAECPATVMKRSDMEASISSYVDAKAMDAWIATIAR